MNNSFITNLIWEELSQAKFRVEYINQLRENIDKLEIIKMTIQNMNYEFYTSNSIKKLLNFNNY